MKNLKKKSTLSKQAKTMNCLPCLSLSSGKDHQNGRSSLCFVLIILHTFLNNLCPSCCSTDSPWEASPLPASILSEKNKSRINEHAFWSWMIPATNRALSEMLQGWEPGVGAGVGVGGWYFTMACEGLWDASSIKDVTFCNDFLSQGYQLLNLGRLQIQEDLSSFFFFLDPGGGGKSA